MKLFLESSSKTKGEQHLPAEHRSVMFCSIYNLLSANNIVKLPPLSEQEIINQQKHQHSNKLSPRTVAFSRVTLKKSTGGCAYFYTLLKISPIPLSNLSAARKSPLKTRSSYIQKRSILCIGNFSL
ncbi:receptor-type tyrosine-protein phosphatase O [Platysternon megacephalum]|uniref:Receptor-type tyrosine-protein phosphatase O n=1 Tax=Platysternon megacephalum TaxID=55544 RepID=A0A4D9EGJ4_9SAUR|nr:receptor-type tyrosine-protein phosphatase O [Platysternon megacephalum]